MLMMHALKNNYVQSAYRTSCWYSLPPFLYIYIGSYRSPSPSCVWCSVARFLLCWTGHLSHLPHCIHHHTSCIQVSVDVTLINSLCCLLCQISKQIKKCCILIVDCFASKNLIARCPLEIGVVTSCLCSSQTKTCCRQRLWHHCSEELYRYWVNRK